MNKTERGKRPYEDFLELGKTFCIIAFILVITVMGLLSIFLPKKDVSEIEKRELAKMPKFTVSSLFSGEYTKEFSEYYSDNFPFRDSFVSMANRFTELFGTSYDGIRLRPGQSFKQTPPPIVENLLPPTDEENSSESPSASELPTTSEQPSSVVEESSSTPTEVVTNPDESTTNNGIFIYKNKAYQLFYGGPKTGYSYAQAIAKLSAQLPEIQFYSLVVPSPIEFALPPKYRSVSAEEKPQIDTMYNNITTLSEGRVKTIDAYSNIAAHKDEYLYFGTDHHWTSLGAYYAYQSFCEGAGLNAISLEGLEKRTKPNFLGTLYARTRDSSLAANPDYVDYYMMPTASTAYYYQGGGHVRGGPSSIYAEGASGGNSYSVFISGDMPLTVIDTEIQNGRTIAVVKESFGNAFVPYLVNNYQRIVVVDPRHCIRNFGDILATFGVNEVLIINNIFAAHTPGNMNFMWRLSNEVASYQNGSWLTPPPVVEEEVVEETPPPAEGEGIIIFDPDDE